MAGWILKGSQTGDSKRKDISGGRSCGGGAARLKYRLERGQKPAQFLGRIDGHQTGFGELEHGLGFLPFPVEDRAGCRAGQGGAEHLTVLLLRHDVMRCESQGVYDCLRSRRLRKRPACPIQEKRRLVHGVTDLVVDLIGRGRRGLAHREVMPAEEVLMLNKVATPWVVAA